MRALLWICLLPAACSRPHLEQRLGAADLQTRPTDQAAIAGCRGDGNDVRLDVPGEIEAPVIVLEEIHLHGRGPSQPTIAIWADGHVVFSKDVAGTSVELEGQIAPPVATATASRVFAAIESLPRFTDAYMDYSVSGGQLTTITVRDGATWRTVSVYGYWRDDLEPGATYRTAEPEPAAPPEPGDDFGLPLGPLRRTPLAPAFAMAYRQLLALAPTTGTRFRPHDFDVVFAALDNSPRPTPIEWPLDLPAPPAELQPSGCISFATGGCPFVLGPQYRDAAARFVTRSTTTRGHVLVHGKSFVARFDRMYRGERVIDAVVACGEELGTRANPTQQRP